MDFPGSTFTVLIQDQMLPGALTFRVLPVFRGDYLRRGA